LNIAESLVFVDCRAWRDAETYMGCGSPFQPFCV
jgi:hypothetical protein